MLPAAARQVRPLKDRNHKGIEAASVATEIVLLTGVIVVLESLEATVAGAATAAA
jgi:hypothetical protein